MTRRQRGDAPGAIHHVMNRGVNHQRVFFSDGDRIEFGERLAEIHERFDVTTLAYCLVENHYHLLVQTRSGRLSEAMQQLGLMFTRRVNDRAGRDGPLFRGRFRSIPVTTDAYLLCAARYVHRNALDVRGVDAVDRYRWSSYRAYLGMRPAPPFLDTSMVLQYFDGDVERFDRFTTGDADLSAPSPDDLVQLVRWAVVQGDLRRDDGAPAPGWQERTALALLADRLGPTDPGLAARLDDLLAYPSAAARRMAKRRASERAAHPAIATVVTDVLAALGTDRRAA